MARKPSTKPKPSDLQGYVIDRERPAPKFLSENLLGEEDEDEIEPTPTSYAPLRPLQPQRHFSADGSGRLVIAIDYGTTFTGKRKTFGMIENPNQLMCFLRCCFCSPTIR